MFHRRSLNQAVPVESTATARRPQLPPLVAVTNDGLEHFGITVPDVERAGRFYGPIFNPELHKEAMEPSRYSVRWA
jgi:hypothetical protein